MAEALRAAVLAGLGSPKGRAALLALPPSSPLRATQALLAANRCCTSVDG